MGTRFRIEPPPRGDRRDGTEGFLSLRMPRIVPSCMEPFWLDGGAFALAPGSRVEPTEANRYRETAFDPKRAVRSSGPAARL
jgi:hypothetical protein